MNYFRQQSKEFGMPPKPQKKTGAARRSGEWVVAPRAALDLEDAARAQEVGEGSGQQAGRRRQEGERESIEPGGGGATEQEEERRRAGELREREEREGGEEGAGRAGEGGEEAAGRAGEGVGRAGEGVEEGAVRAGGAGQAQPKQGERREEGEKW